MSIVSETAIAAVLVTLGKWAKGEGLSARFAMAGGFVVLFLFILQGMNEKFAEAFGALLVFTSLLTYGPVIAEKAGLINTSTTTTNTPSTPKSMSGGAGGGGFNAG